MVVDEEIITLVGDSKDIVGLGVWTSDENMLEVSNTVGFVEYCVGIIVEELGMVFRVSLTFEVIELAMDVDVEDSSALEEEVNVDFVRILESTFDSVVASVWVFVFKDCEFSAVDVLCATCPALVRVST